MWVKSDYSQIIGEVKQRNRLLKAILEIKEVSIEGCSKEISADTKQQFEMIITKCDEVLKSTNSAGTYERDQAVKS